jgi:D-tyrosyl-tRNA(Tyr) deacylase
VRDELVSEIGPGVLLFVGVGADDGFGEYDRLAEKVFHLRVFEDEQGKMNRSLSEIGGEVLVVPQFTLYGDVRKGRRPSWDGAAPPEIAGIGRGLREGARGARRDRPTGSSASTHASRERRPGDPVDRHGRQ